MRAECSALLFGAFLLLGLGGLLGAGCAPRSLPPPAPRVILMTDAPHEWVARLLGEEGAGVGTANVGPYRTGARAEITGDDAVWAALALSDSLEAAGYGLVLHPQATYPEGAPVCVRPAVLFAPADSLPPGRLPPPQLVMAHGPGAAETVWVQLVTDGTGAVVCAEAIAGPPARFAEALRQAASTRHAPGPDAPAWPQRILLPVHLPAAP